MQIYADDWVDDRGARPVSHGYMENNDFPCANAAPHSVMLGMHSLRPVKRCPLACHFFCYQYIAAFYVEQLHGSNINPLRDQCLGGACVTATAVHILTTESAMLCVGGLRGATL